MKQTFTLNKEQKLRYVDTYDEQDWRDDLMSMIDKEWTIVYDDTISIYEYPCSLYISGNEYDQLAKDYTETILGGGIKL